MNTAYTGNKSQLSFWQIWNMCFGFFGIQFGWSLQMGNMSAIYEFLGASPEQIPGLWLAAPMTGLLVQPIVGYFSDRTWHPKLGRRRPFFLVGAILSSVLLFVMPNSGSMWMAAGVLWILDSSINVTMEPFRAFVADNLDDKQYVDHIDGNRYNNDPSNHATVCPNVHMLKTQRQKDFLKTYTFGKAKI